MWLKKIRKKKLQSVLIVLIVSICSLLMCGSIVIITSLNKPYETLREETKAPAVKVFPYENSMDKENYWVTKLNKIDSVKEVVPAAKHSISEKVSCKGKEIDAFFAFVEYNKRVYKNIRNVEGARKPSSDNEVIIPKVMASEFKINLNDYIDVTSGDKKYSYKVAGTFADPFSTNISFQSELLVTKIPDGLTKQLELNVYGNDGVKGSEITEAYLKNNNGVLEGSFNEVESCLTNSAVTEQIMGAILLLLSVIIFIVCIMMIKYMIKHALMQDTKSIAVYKSIGYENKDVINLYMKFYLFLIGIGSVAGILLSPLLSNSFMNAAYTNIGEKSTTRLLVPGAGCFAVIMILSFVQIIFILNKIKNMKPVIALNGREGELKTPKKKRKIFFKKLRFSPFNMALRTIERDRRNTVLIIITCFLCVYMVNFAASCISLIGQFRTSNYYWLGFDKYDVSLVALDKDTFDKNCEDIKNDPDVEKIIKNNMETGISLKWQEGFGDPALSAKVYKTYDDLQTVLVKGRNPKKSNEVVLGNLIAKKIKKDVGDYIDIYLPGNKKVSMLIVGLSQGFYNMGREARLLESTYKENNVPVELNEASVYLKSGVDKKAFIKKCNNLYKDEVKAIDRTEKYKSITDTIMNPQKAAIKPFAVLVIIMGGLNILCILYLKNARYMKTYSIYKSIGYSAKHLIKMNICYVGIIAAASIVVAVPLFLFSFPRFMVLELSMFGFEQYNVNINPLYIAAANVIMFAVFMIGVLLSSKNLMENHIKELNRE